MPQVVIANRLDTGLVVFLGRDESWVSDIASSEVANSEQESEQLLETAKRLEANQQVVDPNLIDVREQEGAIVPVRYRELIRAQGGPTILLDELRGR